MESKSKTNLLFSLFTSYSKLNDADISPASQSLKVTISQIYFRHGVVFSVLNKLNISKAVGPDKNSAAVLKTCLHNLADPF